MKRRSKSKKIIDGACPGPGPADLEKLCPRWFRPLPPRPVVPEAVPEPLPEPDFKVLLKAWRRRKDWTQAKAARKLLVPYKTYLDWEQGRHRPNQFTRRILLAITTESR